MKNLNKYFDHTILKSEAVEADIIKLCQEAKEYDFYSVCVNPCNVTLAAGLLQGTDVKVASVVGFPLGASPTEVKSLETEIACKDGASEIDMVINVGFLKDGKYQEVEQDIAAVVTTAKKYHAIVKVILETCLLSDEEIVKACQLSKEAGAAFVKTSTGFSTAGATAAHVKLMKETVGDSMSVKASGGIRDYVTTMEMINAGADRIGASASVNILKNSEI